MSSHIISGVILLTSFLKFFSCSPLRIFSLICMNCIEFGLILHKKLNVKVRDCIMCIIDSLYFL